MRKSDIAEATRFKHLRFTSVAGKGEGAHLLILAGVHGDEYEPMAAARRLMETLGGVLLRGRVTIAPMVNYPAFRLASRTGDDGLDLARSCPGKADGSATEALASEVSALIGSADYLVDMHGGGNAFEIYPLAGYVLHDSPAVLEKQRQMARTFDLDVIWGTSNKLNGRTLSVARDLNVPAIYTEFGGGGGFKKHIVEACVRGCANIMRHLDMCEGDVEITGGRFELEDARDESGHLQVMLPAASDGFFEALVAPGDFVKYDQPIGTIYDPFGKALSTARADQDGMIFMIRVVPSVRKGDALGGILPVLKPGKYRIS